jgi:tetratricopeptide (TPR) repeat protein
METKSEWQIFLLAFICLFVAMPMHVKSQDAEKQKIVDVINLELESFYKKDQQKWADCWVHDAKTSMSQSDGYGFFSIVSWDSLSAQRAKYFSTPVDPEMVSIKKSDFDVVIKGPVAIVDLVEKRPDFTSNQMVLLEKQGKVWRIYRMTNASKQSFAPNDTNVEAGLNRQGYQLLVMKKIDAAIQVFTLNTQLFPGAFNTWDSLAEAYMIKGEKDLAIAFYKKSIALNAKNQNGKNMIEKLTAN